MGTAFFHTLDRCNAVRAAASTWLGTPWCANSQAKGMRGGVSCHNLPRAILMECGALPSDTPNITGDPSETQHSKVSVIEPWLDASPYFQRLKDTERPWVWNLNIGDVIGIQIGRCVNHLGLITGITGREFVHVLMHKHTCFDFLADPTWSSRVRAAWRPLDLSSIQNPATSIVQ